MKGNTCCLLYKKGAKLNSLRKNKFFHIKHFIFEMSEVSSETGILFVSVPKQTDPAILWSALQIYAK